MRGESPPPRPHGTAIQSIDLDTVLTLVFGRSSPVVRLNLCKISSLESATPLCFALPETHERRERRFLPCNIKIRWLVIYPHFCFTLRRAPHSCRLNEHPEKGNSQQAKRQRSSELQSFIQSPKYLARDHIITIISPCLLDES